MRGEQGHAGVEVALAVALLLIPTALITLGFGPWTERSVLAESLAAEGARAAVLALSLDSGGQVIDTISANYGLEDDEVRVGWCGTSPAAPASGGCTFSRGANVGVVVEVWVPLFNTPWGAIGGIWVRGDHSEPVDLYRSLG